MPHDALYWLGNAAKTKIIGDILRQIADRKDEQVLIFDYGCGTAWGWPAILKEHPRVRLIGYEPLKESVREAREHLQGFDAALFTDNELDQQSFQADFIVSFSVFEHVYDRDAYLRTAKKHLRPGGKFYLNYDDGHFRIDVDLDRIGEGFGNVREWLHNRMAPMLAKMGKKSGFQSRVERDAVDRQVAELGFSVLSAFYSNLENLKRLFKFIPAERREDFTRTWLQIEDDLNARFLAEGSEKALGDTANLWQVMPSRTLVLTHGA